jgi:uncharacterized membrane protein YkvA (DUF1232 family)
MSGEIAMVVAGIWIASPIDLIPEFLPVIGPLDDILVVALALRYAAPPSSLRGSLASLARRPASTQPTDR